jgi:hypothetical protein
MPTIYFGGRILPTAIQITINDHPTINWKDSELDLDIAFTISINTGEVRVVCELSKFDQREHLARIYMRAFDLVRATVDLTSFSTGYGLTVIIDSFTDTLGVTTPFVPHDPAKAALCTAFTMAPATTIDANEFHKVLVIVLTDWRLFRALRELIEAITLPHESSVNCARCIEAIRHIIASPNRSRNQAWGEMRSALNLSEPYLKLITDVSTGPRHGAPVHIPGNTTTEITRRAWIIMNRFLEYKKRDSTPLPLTDFPVLTS